MSRYVALLLFLAILPWSFCRADYSDEFEPTEGTLVDTTSSVQPTSTPTAESTTKPTTAAPTTKPTTAAPTTKPTTAAPTTKPTTAALTTKPTTAAPTTKPTTPAPTTTIKAPTTTDSSANTTSTAPNTTTTAPAPTTTAAPPLPEPTARLYEIKKGDDTCLMVKFGLRIGFYGAKYEEMNLDPNDTLTVVNGSCAENSSMLVIQAEALTLSLTFLNDTKKFSLHALNATGKLNSGVTFSESNNNLTLWQASLGNSYMCNKEQNNTITKNLAVFTFKLQVQPFGVKKNTFSTAQECSMDDTSILIPIVVGAALAGLILIVVIAYVIGRRKTYVGYQTL